MAEEIVGRGLIEILPDFRKWGAQLSKDLRTATTAFDGSTAGLKRSASAVGSSMATIGKGVGLVGVGVAVASVKMAGDFQAETSVLQTAAGETTKGLKVVRDGILHIAEGTGTGIKNLTDGMYLIEKAGYRGADGLNILKAAAQGAKEENAKLSDVTNAMTSVMASYHLKATDATRVMNGLKTAAGEGKITMEEFSGALSTVLPIASANKISFEQVGGAIATLTQHGTSAREATQELAATIRSLAAPNNVASREMARFGLSSVDVSQKLGQRGLTGTFDLLTQTILKKMGPSGKILMSAFEGTKQSARDAQIMFQKMPPDIQKLAKSYADGKITVGEWTKTMKGVPVESQPMLANFKTLTDRSKGFSRELKSGGPDAKTYTDALKKMTGGAIGLNTTLQLTGESMPGFKERVDKTGKSFNNASTSVEGWDKTQKLFNVRMARAKETLQVVAIEIGTKLIPILTTMIDFMGKHKDLVLDLVYALGALAAATVVAYIASKLYAVYTTAAAIATGIWTVVTLAQTDSTALLTIQLGLLAISEKAVAFWTGITSSAFWELTAAILANPITWIVVAIVALIAVIVLIATKTTWFQTIWKYTWNAIKVGFEGVMKVGAVVVDWFKAHWKWFLLLAGPWGIAVLLIMKYWDQIVGGAKVVLGWFKTGWNAIYKYVVQPFIDLGVGIYDHLVKPIVVAAQAVLDWVKGHWKWLVLLSGPIGAAVLLIIKWWGKIVEGAQAALGLLMDLFVKLPVRILSAIGNFLLLLYDKGKDLVAGLLHGAEAVASTIGTWLTSHIFSPVGNFFKGAGTWLYNHGKEIITGMFNGAAAVAGTVNAWMTSHVYSPVGGFFKSAGTWLYSHGKSIITGLLSGAAAIASTINTWMTSHVYNPVGGFFRSAGTWLYSHGKDIISGLLNGAVAVANGINKWMTTHVYSPVTGALKNAGTWLYSKGKDLISGLLSGATAGLSAVGTWASKVFNAVVGAIKTTFGIKSPSTEMAKLGVHMMSGLLNGLLSKSSSLKAVAKKLFSSPLDAAKWMLSKGLNVIGFLGKDAASLLGKLFGSVGNSSGPGGVSKWLGVVQQALGMVGQPANLAGITLRRMNQESGGNPTIVNRTDSNWLAGTPSVGLMQVIGPTFRAYAGQFAKTGPFEYGVSTNPLANIYASMRYALSRYGSLISAYGRAGGYALGTDGASSGWHWVGEDGPELRQLRAGDRIKSSTQSARMVSGSQATIHLTVDNHGVIGSKAEALTWLTDSLDQLRRQGRLSTIVKAATG